MSSSEQALASKPEIDGTLTEILIGYHFLSDERVMSVGMAGAIPMAIPLASMVLYYDTFAPPVNKLHFIRVVKAADNKYLSLQAKKQKKSSPSSASPSNSFPSLPRS